MAGTAAPYVRTELTTPAPALVQGLPNRTGRRRRKHDWEQVRSLLETHPGVWLLAVSDMSSAAVDWGRKAKPQSFAGWKGWLDSRRYKIHPASEGIPERFDLWLRWVPPDWTDEDVARAQAEHEQGEGVL